MHILQTESITGTSTSTLPARLNWTRTQIVDRKLPVALVTTPQALSSALRKFESKTAYNFGQLTGRVAHTTSLPDKLCKEDLLAIAKFYAPALCARSLEMVVSKAQQTTSYIKSVQNIISRARWLASRDNRAAITAAYCGASPSKSGQIATCQRAMPTLNMLGVAKERTKSCAMALGVTPA